MQSLQSVVAGPIRWLTGAGSSADSDEGPYEPDVMDVLVVKAMLINGLHLPPEIVDCIIDQAEYWPHTTSSVEYGGQHGGTKVVTKFSNGSGGDLLVSCSRHSCTNLPLTLFLSPASYRPARFPKMANAALLRA